MNLYDFIVKDQNGNDVSLEEFKDKVVLVVNTATECGFTPQYADLQELYDKYNDEGLVILDFPCDQFGHQAPGSDDEIHTFCTSRFGVTFPQFTKIDVNGEEAIPLYGWLEEEGPFEGFDNNPQGEKMDSILVTIDPDYKNNNKIKWNFTKFLIGKDGELIKRFEPTTPIEVVEEEIKEAL